MEKEDQEKTGVSVWPAGWRQPEPPGARGTPGRSGIAEPALSWMLCLGEGSLLRSPNSGVLEESGQ